MTMDPNRKGRPATESEMRGPNIGSGYHLAPAGGEGGTLDKGVELNTSRNKGRAMSESELCRYDARGVDCHVDPSPSPETT